MIDNLKYLFLSALCAGSLSAWGMQTAEIDLLDQELQKKAVYDHEKHLRIDNIRQDESLSTYERYVLLFEEYQSFNYDTAFSLVNKMVDEAQLLGHPDYQAQAELKRAFIYLSSGLFHESVAVFSSIDPGTLSKEDQIYYYTHFARLKYDMADYVLYLHHRGQHPEREGVKAHRSV